MLRRVHWWWAVLGLSFACGSAEADGPVETLSRFLETMDRTGSNESARKEAYSLLDEAAQAALAERARRAARVSGRAFAPWDMLAPGSFRLRFAPADRGGMRATVTGDQAVVQVIAEDGAEKASVPMTRQGGRWRVQLAVPPVRREAASEASQARAVPPEPAAANPKSGVPSGEPAKR